MNYTDAALAYTFLLFPMGLAGIITAQGISKIKKKEQSGKIIAGMGIGLFILIPFVYFLLTNI
ncbi:MAG: hypothetical protein N3A54_02755 [Patescibacteria group bacterium]|nr:hypothetical protein [Patescibacteria group bacterium]